MNDKAVWSQSASYACMWYSNPPSLLPQREVSKLQKKRGGRKKKKGYVCVQIFKTKPSNLLQSSHKVFLPGFVEVKKKAHVNPKGRKKVGAAKKKTPFGSIKRGLSVRTVDAAALGEEGQGALWADFPLCEEMGWSEGKWESFGKQKWPSTSP